MNDKQHEDEASGDRARFVLAHTHADVPRVCLVILTVLAVFAALYAASDIVLPLLLALVLNLLLAPAKRLLVRWKVPHTLAALLLIIGVFAALGGVGTAISLPASQWISRAPESLPKLQERLGVLRQPIDFVRKGIDQLQNAMSQAPDHGQEHGQERGQQPSQGAQQPQQAPAQQSGGSGMAGFGLSVLQGTRAALGQVLTLAVVLFFLLASGDSLLRRLVEIVPGFGDKRRVVEIAAEIEENISGYLLTITVMNLGVGAANGLQMWAQGLPDPLLWGTVAFLLNYIPILGPMAGILMFFFVGLFATDGIWWALLPPAIYFAVHVAEGEVITPMLVARRFTLNPVLVIVSLFFWDWMWGVMGALLAVPLLAIFKIVCDHIPALAPLGHMLGGSGKPGGDAVAS